MEKQRSKSVIKSFRRLLIILLLSVNSIPSLFSQTITAAEVNQLRIEPSAEQSLFTKTDIKFEVTIPKIKPSQIQVYSSQLPSDIYFKTIRKQENYEEGGTKIEVWYSFDRKGTYILPSLPVTIQNRRRSIKFAPVTVEDDPAKQIPRIVAIFTNGNKVSSSDEINDQPLFNAQVGTKLSFTVYLQYSVQLVQFSWDLPKDSIFTQTKQYEITEVKYREKNYSHDLIPVATFEWTALKTGIQTLPKIKITATAYNGYRNELLLPETTINFIEGKAFSNAKDDKMFDAAFNQASPVTKNDNTIEITDELCNQLARLYAEERNSIFKTKDKRRARMEFENSLGLPSTEQGDFSTGLIHISGLLLIALIILIIIAFKRKHTIHVLFLCVFICCAGFTFVYQIIKHSQIYGICKGCQICSVPEESAEAVSEIGAGNIVSITEQAGKWYYIEFGETGGWCLKDNVIIIK